MGGARQHNRVPGDGRKHDAHRRAAVVRLRARHPPQGARARPSLLRRLPKVPTHILCKPAVHPPSFRSRLLLIHGALENKGEREERRAREERRYRQRNIF